MTEDASAFRAVHRELPVSVKGERRKSAGITFQPAERNQVTPHGLADRYPRGK